MTLTDLPAFAVHTITSGTEAEAVAHLQARGALVQARAPLLRMSSLHDLEHRRPLEIEETLGYVVTQAATMGLAVPTVDTCYRLMRGLNRCMQRASGSPCWRCGAEGISQGMGPTPSKVRSCLTAASSGGAPSASGSSVLFTSRILLKHIAQMCLIGAHQSWRRHQEGSKPVFATLRVGLTGSVGFWEDALSSPPRREAAPLLHRDVEAEDRVQ